MEYVYILISALVGAAVLGLLGWIKESSNWDTKRFLQSILSGLGAAILYAIAYQFQENGITIVDILTAAAWGMAGDNLVNRVIGAAKKVG
jgi:hypothetical protein